MKNSLQSFFSRKGAKKLFLKFFNSYHNTQKIEKKSTTANLVGL